VTRHAATDRNLRAEDVIGRMEAGVPADAALVDDYYTLCIPFYSEFLGEHWHTGWYLEQGPTGPEDQLRMELRVAASAGIDATSIVLDVGCGVGGPACHLAAMTGARIHGLTPNTEQLERARRLAIKRGVQGQVTFHLGAADRLPFDDDAVDVVLFFESACHFPDRQRFFDEAYRVLRAGGRLAGEDWLASEHAAHGDHSAWLSAIEANWAIPKLGTLEGYAHAMRRSGFDVDEAIDLRAEMPLLRGFIASPEDRDVVRAERLATADPIRRKIMQGLEVLGQAAERGAFTVGRFLARKL
jgi:ubiquinone/menaquinone biosynthesis C-methylase UbiE